MKRKKLLMALFMTITAFFGSVLVVNAVSNVPSQMNVNHVTRYSGNNPLRVNRNFVVMKSTDGKFVYCIDFKMKSADGNLYKKASEITDYGLAYIVGQGINNKTETDYFITQIATYIYLSDKGAMRPDTTGAIRDYKNAVYSSSNNSNQVALKIRQLISDAKKATKPQKPYLDITTKDIEFTEHESGAYYVSNLIKINSSSDKYKLKIEGAPAGTAQAKGNGGVYIYIPKEKFEEGKVDFRVTISIEEQVYGAYRYNPSTSGYQPVALPYKETLTASDSITINEQLGAVSISKKDKSTGKELPGATLILKNEDGKVIDKWVTSDKPHVIYNLPLGKYTLVETKAPDGYELNEEEITFKITELGVTKRVVMYNEKEEEPEVPEKPEVPEEPEKPETPEEPEEKVDVPVEPTSSFKSMSTTVAGLVVVALGSVLIFKNVKGNEE